MCAYEDLVDAVKPGDRVELVGIYRAHANRSNPNVRTVKTIYRTYIDVIGYTKTDAKRYENEEANMDDDAAMVDEEMDDDNREQALD